MVDSVNLLIIVISLLTDSPVFSYFRIFTLLKLPDCMEKIEKLEVYVI